MADVEWIDVPEVINPHDSDPEEEEEAIEPNPEPEEENEDEDPLEEDMAENHDEELLEAGLEEDPEAGQLMTVAEHNETIEVVAYIAAGEIQAANDRTETAEGLLNAERETTSRLRRLLQNAQMERAALQTRLDRVVEGCHSSYRELERRVVRYPVEEGRRSYLIDRSVVVHMIWESYDYARGV
jgi:hypothetical protein